LFNKLRNKLKKRDALQEELRAIQVEVAKTEEKCVSEFGVGQYVFGKNILNIKQKTTQGRSTPKYKEIMNGIMDQIAYLKSHLPLKGYDKKTSDKFASKLTKEQEALLKAHTTQSEPRTTTVVEVLKAS